MVNREPTRNLGLELVRVTEAAALSAARQMGRGDKNASDRAAVDAMRLVLNSIEMNGVIVIGEGEKDEAPMLYNGEKVGAGHGPEVDIAVDPIDGTRLLATGNPNAIATVAIAPRGTMFNPGPFVYMDKLAVGPESKGKIDIERPIQDNLKAIAKAKGKDLDDLTCVILDRPRNAGMVAEIRKTGARIRSEDVFFAATGITDGELLRGVKYFGDGARTDSMEVRGLTGTIRQIRATHRMDKLNALSSIQY